MESQLLIIVGAGVPFPAPLQQRIDLEVPMETAQLLDGVYLRTLDTGSTIDVETTSRRYRIEYLEGDRIRISGHPRWCPAPTLVSCF